MHGHYFFYFILQYFYFLHYGKSVSKPYLGIFNNYVDITNRVLINESYEIKKIT